MNFDFLKSGTVIAIIAQALIGISLVWDKVLLRQPETKNLASYIFWLGALSVLGLLLIPFGFRLPSAGMAALGFGTGVIHLWANWFYYAALKRGEASQTLAVMGGFSPLFTALIAIFLLAKPFGGSAFGFSFMVLGGFLMFFCEKVDLKRILPSVLLASALFGLTNVLQKVVFNNIGGFVTGYVFFTMGTFVGALSLLIRPLWREQIFRYSKDASPPIRSRYFVNRFLSGVGSFLIFFAISRGSPAVVDAIAGLRYVIIFLGAYLITRMRPDWLREDFSKHVFIGKTIATGLITAGLVLVGLNGNEAEGGGSANLNLHFGSIAWIPPRCSSVNGRGSPFIAAVTTEG